MVAFSHFLGYDRGGNGEFVVNQEQAKVIKFSGPSREGVFVSMPTISKAG